MQGVFYINFTQLLNNKTHFLNISTHFFNNAFYIKKTEIKQVRLQKVTEITLFFNKYGKIIGA